MSFPSSVGPSPACPFVIFDLDGTLTDSEPGIVGATVHALTEVGWPVPDAAGLRRHIGPPLEQGFRELLGMDDATAARARDSFRAYYRERGWAENAVYPGVLPMLRALDEAGVPMAVATAKIQPLADRVVDHFDLRRYFGAVCGAGPDDAAGGKVSIVRAAMDALGVDGPGVGDPGVGDPGVDDPASSATTDALSVSDSDRGTGSDEPDVAGPLALTGQNADSGRSDRPEGGRPTLADGVVVGDRHHDLDAAAALGLVSIVAEWGYGIPAEWERADQRAARPEDVIRILL